LVINEQSFHTVIRTQGDYCTKQQQKDSDCFGAERQRQILVAGHGGEISLILLTDSSKTSQIADP